MQKLNDCLWKTWNRIHGQIFGITWSKIILPNLKKKEKEKKEKAQTKEQQILEEGLHILVDIFKTEKAESKASQTEFV